MSYPTFLRRQSLAIMVVALALSLAGAVAALSLPIGLFPQVAFPASWWTLMPDRAPPTRPR